MGACGSKACGRKMYAMEPVVFGSEPMGQEQGKATAAAVPLPSEAAAEAPKVLKEASTEGRSEGGSTQGTQGPEPAEEPLPARPTRAVGSCEAQGSAPPAPGELGEEPSEAVVRQADQPAAVVSAPAAVAEARAESPDSSDASPKPAAEGPWSVGAHYVFWSGEAEGLRMPGFSSDPAEDSLPEAAAVLTEAASLDSGESTASPKWEGRAEELLLHRGEFGRLSTVDSSEAEAPAEPAAPAEPPAPHRPAGGRHQLPRRLGVQERLSGVCCGAGLMVMVRRSVR